MMTKYTTPDLECLRLTADTQSGAKITPCRATNKSYLDVKGTSSAVKDRLCRNKRTWHLLVSMGGCMGWAYLNNAMASRRGTR